MISSRIFLMICATIMLGYGLGVQAALFFVFGAVWIYTTARRGNLLSWIYEIGLEWERQTSSQQELFSLA